MDIKFVKFCLAFYSIFSVHVRYMQICYTGPDKLSRAVLDDDNDEDGVQREYTWNIFLDFLYGSCKLGSFIRALLGYCVGQCVQA
ncbi:hypothetical protein L2E82_12494 [Cichorium intybus]|uniref:Uncharacterized protein n=1 Tax=Cichorium intybus TaxID=13427 RepID=A0ACB9GGD0_CICIN|nr:hypothetical protein L2E82_12494 [Cichorium intybus]